MKKFIILIPVYNDWKSLFKLLENINREISDQSNLISVLVVNDKSTEEITNNTINFSNLDYVQIINLKKNGGHGHAIATGLKYINDNMSYDYVIPMDGDGEDRPQELIKFFDIINTSSPNIITANRVKRSEGSIFQTCYRIHKFLTYLMTGKMIKFGNYSCLSTSAVQKILSNGSIWLSYSGAVAKNFFSISSIESVRGIRYFGPSKMNFLNLVKHSLNISATFKETIFLRAAILSMILTFVAHYASSYLLIAAALTWILMLYMFFISKNDDLKKLQSSSDNIGEIITLYKKKIKIT